MGQQQIDTFENSVQKSYEMLKIIEERYGWQKRRNQSIAALRAVLHALRDRLTLEQAVSFSAQLTPLIRGIYFEGWNPLAAPKKMHKKEFLKQIKDNFPFATEDQDMEDLVKTAISAINKSIDPAEFKKLSEGLPEDLNELFSSCPPEKETPLLGFCTNKD